MKKLKKILESMTGKKKVICAVGAVAILLLLFLVIITIKNTSADETETTTTVSEEEIAAEEETTEITISDFQLTKNQLNQIKDVIRGFKKVTLDIDCGSKKDLPDIEYDKDIVVSLKTNSGKVKYSKAGTYKVKYVIVFETEKLADYLEENGIDEIDLTDIETTRICVTTTTKVVINEVEEETKEETTTVSSNSSDWSDNSSAGNDDDNASSDNSSDSSSDSAGSNDSGSSKENYSSTMGYLSWDELQSYDINDSDTIRVLYGGYKLTCTYDLFERLYKKGIDNMNTAIEDEYGFAYFFDENYTTTSEARADFAKQLNVSIDDVVENGSSSAIGDNSKLWIYDYWN